MGHEYIAVAECSFFIEGKQRHGGGTRASGWTSTGASNKTAITLSKEASACKLGNLRQEYNS